MKHLIILGAGGHGRVIADIAEKTGQFSNIEFLDDARKEMQGNIKVIGTIRDYTHYLKEACFIVAIGNAHVRESLQRQLQSVGAEIATLIHPAAIIGRNVEIGVGTVIMPGAVINCDVRIGEGVIVNTSCSIDHDCVLDDFVHISVGAHLAGAVNVGTRTMIGAGATVINNVSIDEDVIVGAGAVVIDGLKEEGIYVGVPAKKVVK